MKNFFRSLLLLMLLAVPAAAQDLKVTELPATTVPALTDLLYLIADPGGTPASTKVTLANIFANVKLSAHAATTSAELAAVISNETGSGVLVFGTSPTLTTPVLGVATATSINKLTLTAPASGATLTLADGKTVTVSNTLTFTGTDSSSVAFGAGGTVAYAGGTLAQFAASTSAHLAGVLSNESGTGLAVFNDSPTIVTPTIASFANAAHTHADAAGGGQIDSTAVASGNKAGDGTVFQMFAGSAPAENDCAKFDANGNIITAGAECGSGGGGSGDITAVNTTSPITGGAASGAVTVECATCAVTGSTLAQFAATTSAELAGVISNESGSGALIFGTSPTITSATLVTPTLGAASATSINKMAITAPATSSTLAVADGKTATISNTLTFTGTDTSSVAFGTGGTVAYTGGTLAQFAATTSAQLAGVISNETGSGLLVFGTSPTLVTPILGVAAATSINGLTITTSTGTLTITNGKTASISNTLTFTGTDSSSVAFGTGGTVAYQGGTLAQFAATTSAQLAGIISNETGTGALVFADTPTLATPVIGAATGTSLAVTGSITSGSGGGVSGTIALSGSTSGTVTIQPQATAGTYNFNLPTSAGSSGQVLTSAGGAGSPMTWTTVEGTGTVTSIATTSPITGGTITATGTIGCATCAVTGTGLSQFAATTSAELAGVISNETGTGVLVLATSPTLVTPVLGVATATTINKVALTAPASGSTLTIADGKTLTVSNTLTFTGTDSSSVAFGTGGTVTYTANTLAVFAATTSAQLAGVLSNESGTGLAVFNDSPTIITPTIASLVNANHNHQDSAGGGSLDAAAIAAGTLPIARGGTGVTSITKSIWFGAGSLSTDGTQCAAPAEVTINSGPKIWTIICTDNDGSTIYGSVRMPDSWNAGTVTFTHSYIQTAANTGALNGDIAAQCRGNGEVPSSTWGTEVAIDDAAVVGSNSNDMTTSAAVTAAGTCAAGDMLYFRYQVDATGTTTTAASLHHVGFNMEYGVSSLSD